MRDIRHFIDGKLAEGRSGRFGEVFNPNTGEAQARAPLATADEVDAAVLEGLACRLAPIDVFVPFDARAADVIVAAEFGDRAAEEGFAMVVEEADQFAVHLAAPDDWRNKHSHGESSLDLIVAAES